MRSPSFFTLLLAMGAGVGLTLAWFALARRIAPPPASFFLSDAAYRAQVDFPRKLLPHLFGLIGADTAGRRAWIDKYFYAPRIVQALALYPVHIVPQTIDGVYTETITPAAGVAPGNANRVLINLHGGGFSIGARTGGQLESIPVASVSGLRIIAVDYRQGPENRFPAASEDVATVYRALLKTYPPANIGIFGCSAGGVLAAESVAWFQAHNLPRPGAIGIFCASAGGTLKGDSPRIARFMRQPDIAGGKIAYFDGTDDRDPLVAPVFTQDVLAKFPPTLVISGTRDVALSGAVHTHAELVNLGVEAELHVWEGEGHFFFADTDIPESRQAFAVMAAFFGRHLGTHPL